MIKVELKAADPSRGLTIADLWQFLQQSESMGIDPRTPVNASVGFKRQLKSIDVAGATDADIANGVKISNPEVRK